MDCDCCFVALKSVLLYLSCGCDVLSLIDSVRACIEPQVSTLSLTF